MAYEAYAELATVQAYLNATAVDPQTGNPSGLVANVTQGEVDRAEADINRLSLRSPGHRRDEETGRKLNKEDLLAFQAAALEQAVADQVKFRRFLGEQTMTEPQHGAVSVGKTSISRPDRRRVSQDALEKLVDAELYDASGSASAVAPASVGWYPAGSYNSGLDY